MYSTVVPSSSVWTTWSSHSLSYRVRAVIDRSL
jgi:hypothetical protein